MARQTGGSDHHPSRPFLCEWDVVSHLVHLPRQALQTKNRLEREFQPAAKRDYVGPSTTARPRGISDG